MFLVLTRLDIYLSLRRLALISFNTDDITVMSLVVHRLHSSKLRPRVTRCTFASPSVHICYEAPQRKNGNGLVAYFLFRKARPFRQMMPPLCQRASFAIWRVLQRCAWDLRYSVSFSPAYSCVCIEQRVERLAWQVLAVMEIYRPRFTISLPVSKYFSCPSQRAPRLTACLCHNRILGSNNVTSLPDGIFDDLVSLGIL